MTRKVFASRLRGVLRAAIIASVATISGGAADAQAKAKAEAAKRARGAAISVKGAPRAMATFLCLYLSEEVCK